MYSFESTKSKSSLHVLTIACFVTAFLLFGVSSMEGMAYPMLYQLTGIVLLVVGVYFLTRYTLKKYRYEISPSNITDAFGQPILDFVITETTGKRVMVVARVALRDIAQVEVADKGQDGLSPKEKLAQLQSKYAEDSQKLIVFRYVNAPLASACYIVVPEERSILVIPFDKKMVSALRQGMDRDISLS